MANISCSSAGCYFIEYSLGDAFGDWDSTVGRETSIEREDTSDVRGEFSCCDLPSLIYNFVVALFKFFLSYCCTSSSSTVKVKKEAPGVEISQRTVEIYQRNADSTPLTEKLFTRAYLQNKQSMQEGITTDDALVAKGIFHERLKELKGCVKLISVTKTVGNVVAKGKLTVKVDGNEIFETETKPKGTPLTWTPEGIQRHLESGRSIALDHSNDKTYPTFPDFHMNIMGGEEVEIPKAVKGILAALGKEETVAASEEIMRNVRSVAELAPMTRSVEIRANDGQLVVVARGADKNI